MPVIRHISAEMAITAAQNLCCLNMVCSPFPTLYIAYIIGYPEATVPFYTYDWAASNRSSRYFYDLYGVYPNADTANTAVNTASVSGIQIGRAHV